MSRPRTTVARWREPRCQSFAARGSDVIDRTPHSVAASDRVTAASVASRRVARTDAGSVLGDVLLVDGTRGESTCRPRRVRCLDIGRARRLPPDHGTFDRRGRRRRPGARAPRVRPRRPSASRRAQRQRRDPDAERGPEPRARAAADPGLGARGASSSTARRSTTPCEVALRARPNVRVVVTPTRGQGRGDARRLPGGARRLIVALDADGSTDPAEIAGVRRLARCRAPTSSMGSRFAMGGGTTDMEVAPPRRQLGAHEARAARVSASVTPTSATDTSRSGATCFPSLDGPFTGFEVETIIHIRAVRAGLRIAEVPSFESPRIWGTSNLRTFRDGMRVLRAIFGEWRRNRAAVARSRPSGATSDIDPSMARPATPASVAPWPRPSTRIDESHDDERPPSRNVNQLPTRRTLSVVVCCYSPRRAGTCCSATIASVRRQVRPVDELIVVVDHNDLLLERLRGDVADADDRRERAATGSVATAATPACASRPVTSSRSSTTTSRRRRAGRSV